MKYKIGDKVRVREGIEEHDYIDDMFVLDSMLKYRRKVLTISGYRGRVYTFTELTEDENMGVFFTDHMLIPIPAPKYKVGDRVIVRKEMNTSKRYGGVPVTPFMSELGGKTFTIKEIDYATFKVPTYRFEDEGCYWTDEMLEETATPVYRDGDIVQTENGSYYLVWNAKNRHGVRDCGQVHFPEDGDFSVVKVWKPDREAIFTLSDLDLACGELRWEKKTAKEMTVAEIEAKLGYSIKVVKE